MSSRGRSPMPGWRSPWAAAIWIRLWPWAPSGSLAPLAWEGRKEVGLVRLGYRESTAQHLSNPNGRVLLDRATHESGNDPQGAGNDPQGDCYVQASDDVGSRRCRGAGWVRQ